MTATNRPHMQVLKDTIGRKEGYKSILSFG